MPGYLFAEGADIFSPPNVAIKTVPL
ncbi:hypothetical protein THAOC_01683, partial [Thalassiosira oceanica]